MKIFLNNKSNYLQHQRFHFDFLSNCDKYEQWQAAIDQYDCWMKREKDAKYIPKVIHQIWIGDSLPSTYAEFQKTWRSKMPEYEYKMWNEESILELSSPLMPLFKRVKNPGTKSDIARYIILEAEGGIYVDTDFECIKRMDTCLAGSTFVCGQSPGSESGDVEYLIGLIACTPKHRVMEMIVSRLEAISEINEADAMSIINATGPGLLTDVLKTTEKDETIGCAPSNYFYPWPAFMKSSEGRPEEYCDDSSYAIHHWGCSWFKYIEEEKLTVLTKIQRKFAAGLKRLGLK
jgi:mannosyltransferase OCH1-like enzyme